MSQFRLGISPLDGGEFGKGSVVSKGDRNIQVFGNLKPVEIVEDVFF